jgi:hypothetical protein
MKLPSQTELQKKQITFYTLANGLLSLVYVGGAIWLVMQVINSLT